VRRIGATLVGDAWRNIGQRLYLSDVDGARWFGRIRIENGIARCCVCVCVFSFVGSLFCDFSQSQLLNVNDIQWSQLLATLGDYVVTHRGLLTLNQKDLKKGSVLFFVVVVKLNRHLIKN
jgi:hypothetical protein